MTNMGKWLTISILVLLISCAAFGAGPARKTALQDGHIIAGVDGRLTGADGKWSFEFDPDPSSDKNKPLAGMKLELLPSSTLEKITADAQKRPAANYRLWGKVTKYKDKNFIFAFYFLPVTEKTAPVETTEQKEPQQEKDPGPKINEPNDALVIPEEIVAKLPTRRIIRTEPLKKGLQLEQDFILADRIGFIRNSEDRAGFVLDALGRNIPQTSLELLPCQILERALRKQSAQPDPVRFKISGIVTKYKGKHYLLLQRATRAYSYGNFGK